MRERFCDLSGSLQEFCFALGAIALAAVIFALPRSHPLIVMGLAAIFASTGLVKPIPNPSGGSIFPTNSVKIVAALLWLPQDVLLGVAAGSLLGLLLFQRNELWRAAINASGWGLASASAALTAHLVQAAIGPGMVQLTAAAVTAVVTNRVMNEGIFSVYRSLRFGFPFLPTWRQNVLDQWMSQILAAPMGIVLAAAAGRLGTVWSSLALTGVSALALPIPRQELGYYYRAQEAVAEVVEAVVRALEGVDQNTRAHGDRVSQLAGAVGQRLRMSEEGLRALRLAARLHDVGFLAGPDGPTPHDHHSVAGGRILAQSPDPLIARIVRAHHERWDGTGLPDRIAGHAIPLGARIIAAVEIYDELCFGSGANESATSTAEALRRVRGLAGTALDPRVVAALISIVGGQAPRAAMAQ